MSKQHSIDESRQYIEYKNTSRNFDYISAEGMTTYFEPEQRERNVDA